MRERGFDAKKDQTMRLLKVVMIVLAAMVTQSCKITMPSLVELISKYEARVDIRIVEPTGSAYDFRKSKALKMKTGFKDTLVIGDKFRVIDTSLPLTGYIHGVQMKAIMRSTHLPEENIVFIEEFQRFELVGNNVRNIGLGILVSDEREALRRKTRVVLLPLLLPLTYQTDVANVLSTDILFVIGTGNMHDSFKEDRDMYSPGHIVWREPFWWEGGSISYENVIEVYKTGKAIAATSAQVNEDGMVEPLEVVVQCGDIKESCFAVTPDQFTSATSARLAAMSFYLSQFWETPEEVVEVLKQCAIDVGEPGVDREYGQGVANLLCPAVLQKEMEVVSQYIQQTEVSPETQGGELEGDWEAKNTRLQVHIPTVLKETVQPVYEGVVNGTISFTGNTTVADFTAEASVQLDFLLLETIKAKATDRIHTTGMFTTKNDTLALSGRTLTYTATEDSLHLVQSYTLTEALALLPESFSSMLSAADSFATDPLKIRMSFTKAHPALVGDFNKDGTVDTADFLIFVEAFGSRRGDRVYDETLDIVPDGIINIADFLLFIDQFGKTRDS